MINVDLLNIKIRRQFIYLIKKFSKELRDMKSCLLIIFSNKDYILHTIMTKTKNILAFPSLPTSNSTFLFDERYKTFIIESINCGFGKSEKIKNGDIYEKINKQFNKKRNYIYFPIGGNLSRNNLIERFKNLPDMSDIKKNFTIHFDISPTKEIYFLNEFFFKLIKVNIKKNRT
jgi:hypothetical protein